MSLRDRLLEKDAPFAAALLLALAGWTAQRLYSNFAEADLVLVSYSSTEDYFEGTLENTSKSLSATEVSLIIDAGGRTPADGKASCVSLPPFDTPSSSVAETRAERVDCLFSILHPGQTVRLRTAWEKAGAGSGDPPQFLVSLPQQNGPKFVRSRFLHRIGREGNYVLAALLFVSLGLCALLLLGGRRRTG